MFDYNGRKFHFFVNGEPHHKTCFGGFIIFLCICVLLYVSISMSILFYQRDSPIFNVIFGNIDYTALKDNWKPIKREFADIINISYNKVDNSEEIFNFTVSGMNSDNLSLLSYTKINEINLNFSKFNLSESQVFISFSYSGDNIEFFKKFSNTYTSLQFQLNFSNYLVNPFNYYNKIQKTSIIKSCSLNKNRGVH